MVINKFDTTSDLHLIYPDKDRPADIVQTAQAFIRYEQRRPLQAQLPHTPILIDLLRQWADNDQKRTDGETQRAVAAEQVQQFDQAVIDMVRHARKTLDAAFPTNPAKAKAWGFEAKQSTQNILLPRTRDDHLRVLGHYIAREQSRPAAERFRSPDLSEAIRVHEALRRQIALRQAGQNQREAAVAASYVIGVKMHYYLQAAVTHLLAFKFDFIVTVELQKWGFNVVSRRATTGKGEDAATADTSTAAPSTPEPAPAASAPEAASTNGVTTNGSQPEDPDIIPDRVTEDWE